MINESKIAEITEVIIKTVSVKYNNELENILRTVVKPPIKGKITKGKIKWRGIRLCQKNQGMESISWMEQRGTQVGPTFVFSGEIKI